MVLDVFFQWQDQSVVDLEVVQDIKHEPSLPLLSHHKTEKETEPSRLTLIMDLCTEQKHIYESCLALVFRLLHLADRGLICLPTASFFFPIIVNFRLFIIHLCLSFHLYLTFILYISK